MLFYGVILACVVASGLWLLSPDGPEDLRTSLLEDIVNPKMSEGDPPSTGDEAARPSPNHLAP